MELQRDVVMTDGSIVTFGAKQRMKKSIIEGELPTVRFQFDNGEIADYTVPESLIKHAAAHGLSQRLGDVAAAKKDLTTGDIAQLIAENYSATFGAAEPVWASHRTSDGLSGAGLLARALVIKTGKTIEQVTAFLGQKSKSEKAAFMRIPEIAAIIDTLRPAPAEVNVEDLLSGL